MAEHLEEGRFYGQVTERYSLPGFVASDLRHAQGRRLPHHSHARVFLSMLVAGAYREESRTSRLEYAPFTAAMHPEGYDHRDEIGNPGARMFAVEIATEVFERLGVRPPMDLLADQTGGAVMQSSVRLLRTWRTDSLTELAAQEFVAGVADRPRTTDRVPPGWLRNLVDRLESDPGAPVSLDQLAVDAGVHPVHVSRSFQRFERQSISDRVRQLRLRRVCGALADREVSLAGIAVDAGFTDQSHLTRVFKRQFGVTPGRFRRLILTH